MLKNRRIGVIIPTYNHGTRISDVVRQALALELPVFVVDDGSTDNSAEILSAIEGISLLTHQHNQGKGAALRTGFKAARSSCDWAVTLDADGQHKPEDAIRLIQGVPDGMRPIVIGARQGMSGEHVPWTSRFGRRFSNFWVWAAGGPLVSDSQSGFRLYPLPEVLELDVQAKRFQFEVEILVKAHQQGVPVLEAPVRVVYQKGEERISHFHPWKDFLRNSATFSRLIWNRIFSRRRKR